jgi:hypothetical protein
MQGNKKQKQLGHVAPDVELAVTSNPIANTASSSNKVAANPNADSRDNEEVSVYVDEEELDPTDYHYVEQNEVPVNPLLQNKGDH